MLTYQPVAESADKRTLSVSHAYISWPCRTVSFAHVQNLLLRKFYYYGLSSSYDFDIVHKQGQHIIITTARPLNYVYVIVKIVELLIQVMRL